MDYLKQSSAKKIIWNRTEQELRTFISLCIKHNLVEKPKIIEEYLVNFIIQGNPEFNNIKPIMMKLKSSNRDLIYIIYKLSYKNIILDQNDLWETTSQVFISNKNTPLKPDSMSVEALKVIKKKRTIS